MYFLYDLLHIGAAKKKYNSVKDDPELSESCVSYGWAGVADSLIALAASFGFQWGVSMLIDRNVNSYILGWILCVIFGVLLLTQVATGAINTVWQIKLNKKTVGYLSLLCLLLSVVGIVLTLTLLQI